MEAGAGAGAAGGAEPVAVVARLPPLRPLDSPSRWVGARLRLPLGSRDPLADWNAVGAGLCCAVVPPSHRCADEGWRSERSCCSRFCCLLLRGLVGTAAAAAGSQLRLRVAVVPLLAGPEAAGAGAGAVMAVVAEAGRGAVAASAPAAAA